jgi:hypothetical protein
VLAAVDRAREALHIEQEARQSLRIVRRGRDPLLFLDVYRRLNDTDRAEAGGVKRH